MELHGVAEFLSLYTLVFYQISSSRGIIIRANSKKGKEDLPIILLEAFLTQNLTSLTQNLNH